MTRKDYITRISYIKELITKGAFQSPNVMADKFDCSEKTIRNMVNDLRDNGYDIEFCRKNNRYVLTT